MEQSKKTLSLEIHPKYFWNVDAYHQGLFVILYFPVYGPTHWLLILKINLARIRFLKFLDLMCLILDIK